MFCTYFADARSGIHIPSVTDVSSSSHWMDTNIFGHNRVVFDTSPGPENARLKIFNVSESDDGIYRCRVDFKASQTRTSRLNLTVVGKWIFVLLLFSTKRVNNGVVVEITYSRCLHHCLLKISYTDNLSIEFQRDEL